jgi:hypothetical protein
VQQRQSTAEAFQSPSLIAQQPLTERPSA